MATVELIETDATHGTHGNKRAWLEELAHAVELHGTSYLDHAWVLAKMAAEGLGDYRKSSDAEQEVAIDVMIQTAILFMA